MSKEAAQWDPDFSHSIRGNVEGLEENDGYHPFGHGDPEGDLRRGKAKNWIFNDRRSKS